MVMGGKERVATRQREVGVESGEERKRFFLEWRVRHGVR